jgi:cytokinin riboside 5'-monophosphate phosphoribohydrolase
MGVVADSVLEGGGEVIGVIPRAIFQREVPHRNVSRLHEVGSMHERKSLMAELFDGFIALPGGFGTLEELFEVTTWAQLGLHNKPVGPLDVANYFTPLFALVNHAAAEGFIAQGYERILLHADRPADLLDAFERYPPPSAHTAP